jgi:dipeptidyl aminopeptidase/acylaminoacyl peptidase
MSLRPTSRKRKIFKLTLFAGSLVFLLVSAVLLWLCYRQAQNLAYPISLVAPNTPAQFGFPDWRDVSFQSEDGIQLSGWFIPPPNANGATVLFVHGIGGNRQLSMREAQLLYANGYGMLLFDLRDCGTSGGEVASMGYWEALDVQAAFAFLTAQPEVNPERIVLYGSSMGGATAIRAMRQLPNARGLIIESAYASVVDVVGDGVRRQTGLPAFPFAQIITWLAGRESNANLFEMTPETDIAQIHVPVLIMHGTIDAMIPHAHGERLYAAANEPKEFWLVEGAGHGGLIYTDPQGFAAHVLPFLERVLNQSSMSINSVG